jgi:signal transduction histidine kinase
MIRMPAEIQKAARILVVDDEMANVVLLERLLRHAGYTDVRSTTDPRTVEGLYDEREPDLILLDLHMPHREGIALLGDLRERIAAGGYVPVLVLTADVNAGALRGALAAGAKDFLTKPFDPQEVLLRISNLLDTRFLHLALRDQNRLLEERVRERTERLLQAEKLSAMGQLLAGVAHELNNPLSVVMGQAALLQEGGPATPARALKIGRAAERCVRIVRNFLALAREQPPARGEARLNAVVEEVVELVGYELRTGGVAVRLQLAADLPVLWADALQLHQVVVNLVVNAQHAMATVPAPRFLTIATETLPDPPRVRLTVTDSGPGIPAEVQGRIFEPFFTTKPQGQGTGLGLSLSRGIVESHGGSLTVESTPGHGSAFHVELPVVAPPAHVEAPAPAVAPMERRLILVVDDEGDVSELLAELIERDGHETDTASNGMEALERLAARPYDAIVCDTKMPVLDGQGFYEQVMLKYPHLRGRFAFVTGDILNEDKRAFFEHAGAPHLAKPFELAEVRRIVRELLGNPRALSDDA